jgi:hypothetical protein
MLGAFDAQTNDLLFLSTMPEAEEGFLNTFD